MVIEGGTGTGEQAVHNDSLFTGVGLPLSGSDVGYARGIAPPGAVYHDLGQRNDYINTGTKASPYWETVIPVVAGDHTSVGFTAGTAHNSIVPVADTTASVITGGGIRIHGDGKAVNDSGAIASSDGGTPTLALKTTDEDLHCICIGEGDSTASLQPDHNGPHVLDCSFTGDAITSRKVFCGFIGLSADALVSPVTIAGTTATLVQDDLAGMCFDTDGGDGDRIMFVTNKGNAAATVSTGGAGVDTGVNIPAAGTFQHWRVQVSREGHVTVFLNKVQVGHTSNALDADEEIHPTFVLTSNSANIQTAEVSQWLHRCTGFDNVGDVTKHVPSATA